MVNEIVWGYVGFGVIELVLMVVTLVIARVMMVKRIDEALKVSAQIQQTAIQQTQPIIEKVIEETKPVEEKPKEVPKEQPKELTEVEKLKLQLSIAKKEEIIQEEKEVQEELFICPHKDCVKEFNTEEKMRRHYGMSHYKDLAI
ncbi:hypothetical protein LCGC14_0884690 [marine sediment metagenome]|uniref:C2H2-type domain-containing protein n=1 Tax=marine sediment metagenome TaxID=412755 RepID=A0A0F9PLI1_9ZZZZ